MNWWGEFGPAEVGECRRCGLMKPVAEQECFACWLHRSWVDRESRFIATPFRWNYLLSPKQVAANLDAVKGYIVCGEWETEPDPPGWESEAPPGPGFRICCLPEGHDDGVHSGWNARIRT